VTSIINIELKSESSTEKIKAQLLRNRYYLKGAVAEYVSLASAAGLDR